MGRATFSKSRKTSSRFGTGIVAPVDVSCVGSGLSSPSIAMNATASLDDPLAKLEWAKHHRDCLDARIAAWLNTTPFVVEPHMEDHTRRLELRLREIHPPPITLGLTFGDMINSLRGSLDHLVWQLVLLNKAQPSVGNGFPIVKRETNWDAASAKRLKGVGNEHRDTIRSVQPFHHGPNAPSHPLAFLDHANNLNKHRVISTYLTNAIKFSPTFNFNRPSTGIGERVIYQPMNPGTRIVDGTVLARFRTESPKNDFYIQSVDPIPSDVIRVAFDVGPGAPRNSVVFAEVERIISLFKPAFGS